MEAQNYSIESEMKVISICWNESYTPDLLEPEHFYHTNLGEMYKVIRKHGQFNTDTDMKKYNLDPDLFWKCMDTNAFSKSEIPTLVYKIKEMDFVRNEIKVKQREIVELNDPTANSYQEETQDGFDDLMAEQVDITSGMYKQLNTPWFRLQKDSLFTEGKCITVLCAAPGVGKSFFVTQLNMQFILDGVKSIMWGAEDNSRFHTRRAIAQYLGNSNLCNYEYLQNNNANVMKVYIKNKDMIEKIMKSIYTSKDLDRDSLKKWCWAKAKEGYEVITIDPITFFTSDDKAHIADLEIMKTLDEIRTKYGTRFIIVTHPKSSAENAPISMDATAGGKAMSRFAQVMLWIVKEEDTVRRTVYTLKTRNGRKEYGGAVQMDFNPQTVCFDEVPTHQLNR